MFEKIKDIEIYYNYSLKNLCSFKIGGNAKYFIICKSIKALKQTIKVCLNNNIKYKVIGSGSNLLFDDLGYDGAIIKLDLKILKSKSKYVIASSDIKFANLINFAVEKNLSGTEFFIGIPCSVGGAIKNNLGCFGHELSNILSEVKYLKIEKINLKNKIAKKYLKNNKNIQNDKISFKIIRKTIKKDDFSYRKNNFLDGGIIISAKFKLDNLNKNDILNNMQISLIKKSTSQPLNCFSAGSVFKRNGDFIPAKAIDEIGLKGKKFGDAQISEKHAGFIINLNEASSKDVLKLISFIKKKILKVYGVILEEEIEYIPY